MNDPPVFSVPQSSKSTGRCYTPSGKFKYTVPEKSPEFTKFGPPLEECVSDADPADSIVFSLKPGSDGADLFGISACGGQLLVKEGVDLKYVFGAENGNSYGVTVVATDDQGLRDSANLTISLTNVNDEPTFTSAFPARYSVAENMIPGTAVGPVVTIAADLDNDPLKYSLVHNEDGAFYIDPNSGHISTDLLREDPSHR